MQPRLVRPKQSSGVWYLDEKLLSKVCNESDALKNDGVFLQLHVGKSDMMLSSPKGILHLEGEQQCQDSYGPIDLLDF